MMLNPTAMTVLKADFWTALGGLFISSDFADIGGLIQANASNLEGYSTLTYGNMPFFDYLSTMTASEIANLVFLVIGNSYKRIFDALTASYNPLENFYTSAEYVENSTADNVKTGSITTTLSGTVTTENKGTKTIGLSNEETIVSGTTYDNTSDFKNIGKNQHSYTETEGFSNGYGTETSYDDFGDTQTFNRVRDDASGYKDTTEEKSGNSGIFSKQDLTKREINLRLSNSAFPVLVRMCVDCLNSGVWE